jgi:protocatechuate 3,4-dioxygenase beta subunit
VEFDSSFRALEEFTGVKATSAADGSFELPAIVGGTEAIDLLLFRTGAGFHYIRDARSLLATGSVELPLPKAGAVEGQIIVAGEPVRDSEVHLAWIAPGDDPYSHEMPFGFGGQMTTDAEGRFRYAGLGPGRYRFSRVRSFENPLGGGSMSSYMTSDDLTVLPGQTVTHNVNLPAGHTLTGQTVSTDGKPLANCMVSVSKADEQTGRVDAAMSDAQGRFSVAHLAPGSYSLMANQYDMRPGGGIGIDGAFGNATVKVAGDTSITIKLTPRSQGGRRGAGGQSTLVGSIPPDFTGKLINADGSFTLSDHFGKVVVVGFWAGRNPSTASILPELTKLREKHKDSGDVVLVTVSLDQDQETVRNIIKEESIEFPVIFEDRETGSAIASSFGPVGIPALFVIGRDGRFASDRLQTAQLSAAVEAALKAAPSPALSEGLVPSRLTIKLALDTEEIGLPGATITLKAISPEGKVVSEETIRSVGPAKRFTWRYAPLVGGGEIEVKVETDGLAPQERIVLEPEASAEVAFKFTSPRTIAGSVSADDGATPVPNMKLTAYRQDGFYRIATTDSEGKFKLPALPGMYSLLLVGTDEFAPIGNVREQVDVTAASDPAPVALAACRAVTVTGTVTDEEGNAVAGADVGMSASQNNVKTDANGHFVLAGVPSKGSVQLYAMKQPKYASLTLENFDGTEPQQLVLGQQVGRGGTALAAGAKMPPLVLYSLDKGEPQDWRPQAEKDTLLMFCALWHPKTTELLEQAKTWADEHEANLATISIDWSLPQARRAADALPNRDEYTIHFAGPGGLEIAQPWRLTSLAQAYVVSPSGRIRSSPPPGELP